MQGVSVHWAACSTQRAGAAGGRRGRAWILGSGKRLGAWGGGAAGSGRCLPQLPFHGTMTNIHSASFDQQDVSSVLREGQAVRASRRNPL